MIQINHHCSLRSPMNHDGVIGSLGTRIAMIVQSGGVGVDKKIQHILNQISTLEDDLRAELHQQETRLFYRVSGKRVEFDEAVRKLHRESKTSIGRWLLDSAPLNFVAAPFIYGLIIPLAFLDICISLYQTICFPIYGMVKVRRADYIVMDRWQLRYLNVMERFHCAYCEYGNGLIAYATEIAARTEQYWCPIKHAHKVLGTHARYQRFLVYGESEQYQGRLKQFRDALRKPND
ncbi:hypothetical protein [Paraburkholderia phenazinium]|uniref:hypothetical protein n=1 Tax=Paraburkholderia phenazinium TaxID=60549 RepID=UPI001FC83EA0|nr:hypothetical protein [Paraburkholderia phenazinium]